MDEHLRAAALDYHRAAPAGKIAVVPTKSLVNQHDLSLAYSPGVAAACEAIVDDPAQASEMTSRGNLVAVVTNGTAVLGLGNIGPLASKPVMEGKGCLFKKFAGIDVFDVEIEERDPDKLVDIIASLEPTFGGINLEDIKAPECFYVEKKLRERMKIPVFHDDQHGTAIIVGAAALNALTLIGKRIEEVRIVASGAGAAALACLDQLHALGARMENIFVTDIKGVVYIGRTEEMDEHKARYAKATAARTLGEVIEGADIFLGLSAGGVLKPAMVAKMAPRPVILALANPTPEITPEEAKAIRPDALIATGRSDYPNQVNNVLCFPYLFRGALDVGATTINEAMKLAAVRAIAELARAEASDEVARAYGTQTLRFGADYLIPKPFDPRLMTSVTPAVAKAAMESGVATRPISDFAAYRAGLMRYVYQSGSIMQPVFRAAKETLRRVIFSDGEDERVLRAVQIIVDEGLARPLLLGRPGEIAARIEQLGLRLCDGEHYEIVDAEAQGPEVAESYFALMSRSGVSLDQAYTEVRRNASLLGALQLRAGAADAMLCGIQGPFASHLKPIADVIGKREGARVFATLNALMLQDRTLFICDTNVNYDPSSLDVAAIAAMAAEAVYSFGHTPHIALLSHSSFGSADTPSALKMRDALAILRATRPDFDVEGEMQGDAAVSNELLRQLMPHSSLKADANLLVMPTLDAANIAYSLIKMTSGGNITVGPILLGSSKPVHILTPTATVRRIVNLCALAAVQAGRE